MIVPPDVASRHNFHQPYLQSVGTKVKDLVLAYCEDHGYAFVSRLKKTESLAEKIETGRYEKWSNLDDLFACTIVVPTLNHESDTLEFLRNTFMEADVRKRGSTQKDPAVFRFDSTRFIGKLRPSSSDDSNEPVFRVLFEVQIRTAFEHAWSVTTHAISYKGQKIDWRKLRLAAQLKASVEQMDILILGFEESSKYISEQYWPQIQAMKKIEEFFTEEIRKGIIPAETQPSNWTRFSENVVSMLKSSTRVGGSRVDEHTQEAINSLTVELALFSSDTFPRSISLLQFVFGALVKNGTISPPFSRYFPVITPQLVEIYPAVSGFRNAFKFDE